MAYEEALQRISGPVAANDAAGQYMFYSVNSNGQYALTANGAAADGVLQDDPNTTGFVGEFGIGGVSKVLVGPNGITQGQIGMVDTNGGITTRTSSNVGVGRALATGVSGDIIPVRLFLALY